MKNTNRAIFPWASLLYACAILGCQSPNDKAWRAVQATGSIADNHMPSALVRLANRCQDAFWDALPPDHVDEFVSAYVDQFGRYGTDADIRWMLADSEAFIATDHAQPFGMASPSRQSVYELRVGLLHVDAAASKALVKRFLKEPAILPRYYRAVIWYDQFFGPGGWQQTKLDYGIGQLSKHFNDSTEPAFWLYARYFILLAHATGRDDLWQRKKPEDLKAAFIVWKKWFLGTGNSRSPNLDAAAAYMQLSTDNISWHYAGGPIPVSLRGLPQLVVPDRPFPDGNVLLSAKVISEIPYLDEPPYPPMSAKAQQIGKRVAAKEAASYIPYSTIPTTAPASSR